MDRSELAVRIDRLLAPAKALREAMEARIELKAKDGPPGLWVWREAGDQEASRLRLAKARDAFNVRLATMKAAMVDLEDAGYAGSPRPAKERYIYDRHSPHFLRWARDDGHEPGPAEMGLMYEAVVNSRDTPPGMVADTVGFLRDLEQALLKARAFCSGRDEIPAGGSKDGPVAPDGFVCGGTTHYGLARKPFLTVNFLWQARNRTASADDLAEPVWEDHAATPDRSALDGTRREINSFFRNNGILFHVKRKDLYLVLRDGPPPPAKPLPKSKVKPRRRGR